LVVSARPAPDTSPLSLPDALPIWGRLPPLPLLAGSGLLGLLLAWGSRKAGHTHALELVEQTARRSPLSEMSPGAKVLLCLAGLRSEEHTSELQSRFDLVCRLLLDK